MPIDPREVINSRYGIGFALWLGKVMPFHLGKRMARWAASWIVSHRDWEMVRAVRANRWVVSGGTLQGAELDQAVRDTFQYTADAQFILYHYFQNLEAVLRLVDINPEIEAVLHRPKYEQPGLVLVGLHMGNFDLIVQGSGLLGWEALFLTLPELGGGYQRQYEIRTRTGMNVIPATFSGVKQAINYLRQGGMVVTGIDRPESGMNYRPMFFNRLSALPVHHIVLALKARVPVRVACLHLDADEKYHFNVSDPIEMQPHPDHRQEVLLNAEIVLKVAEEYIRQTPDQWSMTFPVWPEALAEMPG
jgi:KDO2-lipid IV(A) lauroyltransferase